MNITDDSCYAEVDEFSMKDNSCYQVSANGVRSNGIISAGTSKRRRSPLIFSILMVAASIIILAAISACLVLTFREISKLKSGAATSWVSSSRMFHQLKENLKNATWDMIEMLQQQLSQEDSEIETRNREQMDTLQGQINETEQNFESTAQRLQSIITDFYQQLIQKDMETDSRVQELMIRLGFPSLSSSYAAPSCSAILQFCPSAPSGYY